MHERVTRKLKIVIHENKLAFSTIATYDAKKTTQLQFQNTEKTFLGRHNFKVIISTIITITGFPLCRGVIRLETAKNCITRKI